MKGLHGRAASGGRRKGRRRVLTMAAVGVALAGVLTSATAYADDGGDDIASAGSASLGISDTQFSGGSGSGNSDSGGGFANSGGGATGDGGVAAGSTGGGAAGSSGGSYTLPAGSGLDLDLLLAAVPYRPLPVGPDGNIYLPAIDQKYKDKAAIPGFANPIGSWSGTYEDVIDHVDRAFTANINQDGTVSLNDGKVTYTGRWSLNNAGEVELKFQVGILTAYWDFTISGDKGTGTGMVRTDPMATGTLFHFTLTRQRPIA